MVAIFSTQTFVTGNMGATVTMDRMCQQRREPTLSPQSGYLATQTAKIQHDARAQMYGGS